jgi:uncharacterized protein (TIGR03032 family)
MVYDRNDELRVVNTRFCCLCTLDEAHTFHPRWRPPFVSALAPEDRCHLNGLGTWEAGVDTAALRPGLALDVRG